MRGSHRGGRLFQLSQYCLSLRAIFSECTSHCAYERASRAVSASAPPREQQVRLVHFSFPFCVVVEFVLSHVTGGRRARQNCLTRNSCTQSSFQPPARLAVRRRLRFTMHLNVVLRYGAHSLCVHPCSSKYLNFLCSDFSHGFKRHLAHRVWRGR